MSQQLSVPVRPRRRTASVFAGGNVCRIAGLKLTPGATGPLFEQDRWDLSGLADAHRMVTGTELVWDFTEIINPSWRMVAKEVLLAMLAPDHEAVLECALALRSVRSPRTCYRYLRQFIEWFNWLTGEGLVTLEEVTQEMCKRYLEERHWSVPVPGEPRRRLEPGTMRELVSAVQVLTLYGELTSSDGYRTGFAPWSGKTATSVVGVKTTGSNRTPPVPDAILQPLLATCLYLVDVVGPHIADLLDQVRAEAAEDVGLPGGTLAHLPALRQVIEEVRAAGEPLPALADNQTTKRVNRHGTDPLSLLAWGRLSRRAKVGRLSPEVCTRLAPALAELAAEVGFQRPLARKPASIARADNAELVPWTSPLAAEDVNITASYVVIACLVLTAALSGMRHSELLEIEAGCRRPAREIPGGGRRFRLAGRLVKGQTFGGAPDEWVVIEEVDRAVALAEHLLNRPDGEALFPTVDLSTRVKALRRWLERTGNRERWGLPVIPPGPASARMMRRTLALAIAQRPGGLLAAKVALKHISVATTEGYAARPGGSQRLFQAEIEEAEEVHRIALTVQAFRDVQAGILPAGPGARGLVEAFSHVDAALKDAARTDPKVLHDDRHLENLLRKQAKTLHVGSANYCWFRDPSKALCLRMAGTPQATKPLVGMCDSARCPQATHHPCHRLVWANQAASVAVFIESPRVAKGEKIRLLPERDRALRVVAEIDAASTTTVGKD
ncbi:site-specific integrase [Streptomyces sp. NBC_01525]|uniref:integrase n=1 Tax=Streptomyces sp. NBC_01525 TaxID=2903893 RepID=UPI0038658C55